MRRSSWLLSFSLSVFLLSCSATTAIVRKDEPRPQESVHLVIDLGSSGTRFCLYGVKSVPGQGCSLTPLKPICSRVPGGLARLTQGHRVSHVADLVDPPLQHGWSLLGRSKLRGEVRAATALGTGGFRDRVTGQPVERPEWQAAFTEVERFLRREAGLSSVSARPITGQEEGRLAWFGLAQSDGMPEEFAAIEAGGATIQLAVGKKGASPADIEVATDPQGQDVVFDRLFTSDRVLARSFQACYNPRHPRRQDGLKCIELLSREAFRNSAVRRLAEKTSARRLYGLGLSYADLFRSYPAAPPWPQKQDASMHARLSIDQIRQLTVLLCPRTDAEIRKYAPNALAVRRELSSSGSLGPGGSGGSGAGRACYYLAYRVALLDAVRHVAAGDELHAAEEDQWARGAAVSGEFFPNCR
ncbi:MAG: hypothetical protein U1A78_27330 [Polyangia bacterium]